MIKYRKRHDGLYECLEAYTYHSQRYNRYVRIREGQIRDGASGALDIKSSSWWVHDQLCADGHWHMCADGHWHNGDPVTAYQAAQTLSDILTSEGRWARAIYWKWTTFLLGCKRPRQNGWF